MRATVLVCVTVLALAAQSRPPDIPFRIHAIDPGASETAAIADVNRDGRLDIISGEHWFETPAAAVRTLVGRSATPRQGSPIAIGVSLSTGSRWSKHRFRDLGFSNHYVDNFTDLAIDVDADGYTDVVSVSWFARKIAWWRNPGKSGGHWKETVIHSGFNVEFAILADIDNDGNAHEIVAQENGTGQSWYEIGARGPSASGGGAPRLSDDKAWVKHVVSDRSYGHGIGAGDVNGDKRTDILTPRGWLEAPADPRSASWTFHNAWESINVPITPPALSTGSGQAAPPKPPATGAAQVRVAELGFMHVLDVNGDGRNDVVTAAGHDYGVYWFEQGADGAWTRRMIDPAWSQGHASTLVDLNGDGRLDLVTGKRFMAHNGTDPGEREPLGVYWYETFVPGAAGVQWVRHVIDYGGRVGGGMQLPLGDIDGDGDLDLVCPGKSGLFLVENLTKGPGNK